MRDTFATKKRLMLADAGVSAPEIEKIIDWDLRMMDIMATQLRNELKITG